MAHIDDSGPSGRPADRSGAAPPPATGFSRADRRGANNRRGRTAAGADERRELLRARLAAKAEAIPAVQARQLSTWEGLAKEMQLERARSVLRIFDAAALERRAVSDGAIWPDVMQAVLGGDHNNNSSSAPPFRLSVPAFADLELPADGRRAVYVPCAEVMLLAEDATGEPLGGYETLPRPEGGAVGTAAPRTLVAECRAWVPSGVGARVCCSMDGFRVPQLADRDEPYRPDSADDPAARAKAVWSLLPTGLAGFDAACGASVTGHVVAAQVNAPGLLRPGGEAPLAPGRFRVDQPGVVICRESDLLGAADGGPSEGGAPAAPTTPPPLVAVISERHACAFAMLAAPGAASLASMEAYGCGTFEVGTAPDGSGALRCAHLRLPRVFVVPIESYKKCLASLRAEGRAVLDRAAALGELRLRRAEPGDRPVTVSTVTTYAHFDRVPGALLLATNARAFGAGWASTHLLIGARRYDNANEWHAQVETLFGFLRSLVQCTDACVPLRPDGHTVDLDRLADLMVGADNKAAEGQPQVPQA